MNGSSVMVSATKSTNKSRTISSGKATLLAVLYLASTFLFSARQYNILEQHRRQVQALVVEGQETALRHTSLRATGSSTAASSSNNNKAKKPWCRTPEDYNHGEWVKHDDIVAYPYLSDPDPVWGPQCSQLQSDFLAGNGTLPAFLQYKWHPRNCQLALQDHSWNQQAFCSSLQNKVLGVSGDSMSQQFVHSIMGHSRGRIEVDEWWKFVVETPWKQMDEAIPDHWVKLKVPLCDHDTIDYNVTLLYQRWDKYHGGDADRAALTQLAQESDYLLLNWGVHYQQWADMEQAMEDMTSVLKQHWTKQPERLFWRSTNVAHANCDTATGPIPIIAEAVDDSDNQKNINPMNASVIIHPEYHTQEILWQDEYIVKPLLSKKLPHTTLLRIEETTLQRPDGHRVVGHKGTQDCLHYCEPGPIDHWAELFYHYAVALEI